MITMLFKYAGQPACSLWPAVDGADGFILERKANTDADWVQVWKFWS